MNDRTLIGTDAHTSHEIREAGKQVGIHLLAVVAGFVMTIAGLAMGVTMVLLPIGIPVGLIGVLTLVWGLFEWGRPRP